MNRANQPQALHLFLIKPSRYDDEGFVVRHWKGVLPSNTMACLHALTEEVRSRGQLGNVDIRVHLLDETVDKVKAFSIGAVDYITKPFQVEEVLARVHTHITLSNLQKSLQEKNTQLQKAIDEIKTLRGIIPICAHCKKVRDDKGYWNQVEVYIHNHSEAEFSHGICPQCIKDLYPDIFPEGS